MISEIKAEIRNGDKSQLIAKSFDAADGSEWIKHFEMNSISAVEIVNLEKFNYSQMVKTAGNIITFLKPSGYWRIKIFNKFISQLFGHPFNNEILANKKLLSEFLVDKEFIPNFYEGANYADAVKESDCKL